MAYGSQNPLYPLGPPARPPKRQRTKPTKPAAVPLPPLPPPPTDTSTESAFIQSWAQTNSIYESYLGRRATKAEAQAIFKNGTSTYALQQQLSQQPGFYHSPIWKQQAPDYVAGWRAVYGNTRVDRSLITYAIVHNLDQTAYAEVLRERPDYLNSNEFKATAVTMKSTYENIYGQLNANAETVVKQAALAGWTPDQFADYLRNLPEYKFTPEYETKKLTFLDSMGLITGRVPTAKPLPASAMPHGGGTPPADSRLPSATAPTPTGPALKVGA